MMLYKLLNRGALSAIHGCISTGKEANVYYAKGNPTKPVANKKVNLKIIINIYFKNIYFNIYIFCF